MAQTKLASIQVFTTGNVLNRAFYSTGFRVFTSRIVFTTITSKFNE